MVRVASVDNEEIILILSKASGKKKDSVVKKGTLFVAEISHSDDPEDCGEVHQTPTQPKAGTDSESHRPRSPPLEKAATGVSKYIVTGGGVVILKQGSEDADINNEEEALNIVILQSNTKIIHNSVSLMREYKKHPGVNVLLVLDPSWYIRIGGKLFIKKAIILDKVSGSRYIFKEINFPSPVEAHYIHVRAGQPVHDLRGLSVPVSRSYSFEKSAKDKIIAN